MEGTLGSYEGISPPSHNFISVISLRVVTPTSDVKMPALTGVLLAGKPEGQFPFNAFDKLVQDLRDTLGPSSGIDSASIDPKDLQDLMTDYASNPSDWEKYAFEDYSRSYTRNLVDEGNGKANLVRFEAFHPIWSTFVSFTYLAHRCMDSGKDKRDSRPCRCALCYEGPQRKAQGDPLRLAEPKASDKRPAFAAQNHSGENLQNERGDLYV